jgi:hypothetical protein
MSLGIIAIKWAQLEIVLAQYYVMLVLGKESHGHAKIIVIEALEAIPTWQGKCNLPTRATGLRFDSETAKRLSKLLHAIKDTQDDRNEVLHGRWQVSEEAPDKWVHGRSVLGPMKAYDQACLSQISQDITDAMIELGKFFATIKKRLDDTESSYAIALQEMLTSLESSKNSSPSRIAAAAPKSWSP